MSKSYTLADGTNITVTSNENGVPFNEGMQALTKAIKARVSVRDGSGTGGASSGKLVPTINVTVSSGTAQEVNYHGGINESTSILLGVGDAVTITASTDSDTRIIFPQAGYTMSGVIDLQISNYNNGAGIIVKNIRGDGDGDIIATHIYACVLETSKYTSAMDYVAVNCYDQ